MKNKSKENASSSEPQVCMVANKPMTNKSKEKAISSEPQVCIVANKPANLTLHALLKTANPSWSSTELKAVKKKLKAIGIESYSDLEECLLQGILNSRLREHGLKAFAAGTLECLKSTVIAQHEKIRQAAEQAEALAVQEKLLFMQDELRHTTKTSSSPNNARDSGEIQNSQQPSSPSKRTLYMLLKTTNPGWRTKDLDAAMKKLHIIGIASYFDLEEVLLQGRGILNKRLKDNGLKIFAPSTLQRLKLAVNAEATSEPQLIPPTLTPPSPPSQRLSPQRFGLGSGSPSDVETPSPYNAMCSEKGSDDESVDDCMRWYENSRLEVHCMMAERKLSPTNTSACKIKIAPLDLSKAVRMPESQYSGRTESTALPSSPISSRDRSVSFFSIGTP